MAGVWVFAETVDGTPTPVVLELLTKARSLGETTAIALGPGASKAADALGKYGAKKVYVHEDPAFKDVLATPAVELLARLIQKVQPDLVIFGMTYDGRDVASRLSARLGTALIANATDVTTRAGMIPPGVVGNDTGYRSSIPYDPVLANKLLDHFGYKRAADG